MDAAAQGIALIDLMAEVFINLTENPDGNVTEVQVIPVDGQVRLSCALHLVPAAQDGFEVAKNDVLAGLASIFVGLLVSLPAGCLLGGGVTLLH